MVMQWENNKFEQISRDARQHWFCHLANYCTACNKIKLRLEGVSKIEGSLNLGSLYAGFPDLTLVISAQFTFEMSLCARHSQKLQKKPKNPCFESSRSFKVIDVDTTKNCVTSVYCDKQLFSRYTSQYR